MNDYEYLTGNQYELLYAKYLERPSRLLVAPDPAVVLDKGTHLLDLCTGSGVVVRAAIRMGIDSYNIVAVDESKAMNLNMPANVRTYTAPVTRFMTFDRLEEVCRPFDLITCRQAVNYWWDGEIVDRVLGLLAPGGCFVFNTFNTKPADVPQTKQYIYDDHQFAEIAYSIGDAVHHVQAREGLPAHVTIFPWIDPSEFAKPLRAAVMDGVLLNWRRVREGPTDTYIARAKVTL